MKIVIALTILLVALAVAITAQPTITRCIANNFRLPGCQIYRDSFEDAYEDSYDTEADFHAEILTLADTLAGGHGGPCYTPCWTGSMLNRGGPCQGQWNSAVCCANHCCGRNWDILGNWCKK